MSRPLLVFLRVCALVILFLVLSLGLGLLRHLGAVPLIWGAYGVAAGLMFLAAVRRLFPERARPPTTPEGH